MKDLVGYDESGGAVVAASHAVPFPWFPIGPGLRLGRLGKDRNVRVIQIGGNEPVWQVAVYADGEPTKVIAQTPYLDAAIGIAETWWRRPPNE